ncbi:hypothetical protein WJX77_004620 [Trebouxia sp. C0004]
MATTINTEAIVVWDIENNRVPLQLVPRCFEIVQWLLQDVQEQSPNSTVLRIYVAGTFDKYPAQLKNALCTHPRVQLLYSIGKIAKGGEADDALKRVMLDFHITQLVAQKQALLVLLSGDADYNDMVDAARVAGHKVHLYHSHAVAQTLRGNVDHCEAWQDFLARKSGQKVEDLEETGYVVRGASPISKSPGTPPVPRRVPHSHPGVKPVPIQANPNPGQRTPSHRRSMQNSQLASDADSAIQTSLKHGRTVPLKRSGLRHQPATQSASRVTGQLLPTDSLEQPIQAPQDSGDFEASQSTQQGPWGSTRQPFMSSLGNPAANQPSGAVGPNRGGAADSSPSTSATSTSHPAPLGFANPTSDGRTVVVTGFRKGMAGPEVKQRAMDMCAQCGGISACWLRKGKNSCWFVIVRFTESAAAQTAVDECSGESSQNRELGMRWFLAEAPSQAQSRVHRPPDSHAARAGNKDCAVSMPNETQGSSFQQSEYQDVVTLLILL